MSLRFAGYAALFDRVDRGGDVIRAGAFGALPGGVPLLWQHRGAPVGTVERLATDSRGLRVIARVEDARVAALVEAGALAGLSIGYRVRAAVTGRVRQLLALELVEVSLVAAPMQPGARVHLVAGHATRGFPDKVPDPRQPLRGSGESPWLKAPSSG
ncbi:HK97 family phage prohead protease [Sphingomonas sp. RB3P16]|uniref:HK97 family phage prohead protease n=1 Tax=Parasphingomonas frigoris TaxID=3096163 RepID=UPI002FC601AF